MAKITSVTTTTATIGETEFVAWLQAQAANIVALAPLAEIINAPPNLPDRVAQIVFPVSGDNWDALLRAAIPGLPAIGGYSAAITQGGPDDLITVTWTH